MKRVYALGLMLAVFLALGVGSVYANTGEANLGLPILGTTGAPALASPSLYSGAISVLYADGTSVVLETNTVTLNLCNANTCSEVTASLKQTSPGVYTYSFTPPTSLTGTITIYVTAYSLADDNGRIFPSVDTTIGTYAYTPSSSTSGSSVPPTTSAPPAAGTPVQPALTRDAVSTSPTLTTGPSPLEPLLAAIAVLSIAGSILAFGRRR